MVIIILIVILLAVYSAVENRLVLRMRYEDLGGNIKIAHVADLHKRKFGKYNRRICRKIADESPDIILISGDLVSRDCVDFSDAEKFLKKLCGIAPVYMVFGNHESDLSSKYKNELINVVEKSGTVLLNNKTVSIKIKGRKLNLCGIELEPTVYKKNGGYHDLDILELPEMYEKLGKKPDGETILIVHNPLFAKVYSQWGADYAVCGHVHGGAVALPFTRIGILSPERRFMPEYTKGVYTLSRMKLLLSGGLGKFRLFNPPEIVIYEL